MTDRADEAYLQPPKVITTPGPEYADADRAFQGIPGIAITASGRLWATWYGGGTTEDRHNYVLVATNPGGDGEDRGAWSGVCLVVDPDGAGPVRAYDPCLWVDPEGRLRLFWAQGYEGHTDDRAGVWMMLADDGDSADPAWSEPVRICDGIMMNKPTVLSTGEWLLPAARWRLEGSATVCCSSDSGKTWRIIGAATIPNEIERNADEHMIVELQDGRLWMLVRTTYGIGESFSTDRGVTWSPVARWPIQHPTTRFFIRRLASGNLLLCKHGPLNQRIGRSHLSAYISRDEGKNWLGGLLIDERVGVSYPDGVQDPRGYIHLIYDFDRKGEKEILATTFTEDDVVRGRWIPGGAGRPVVVNKARGTAPEKP